MAPKSLGGLNLLSFIVFENVDIALKNNESISLNDYFEAEAEYNPKLKLDHNLLYNPVIQSCDTEMYDFSIINQYLHHAHEKVGFGYKNILDGAVSANWGTPIPRFSWWRNKIKYVDDFQKYFHSLFQNKLARKLMFSAALNILENMCVNYPADFTSRVKEEINNLIEYVKIQNYYTSRTPTNRDDNYWKGFIYRRVEQDGVPLSEVESYLLETKKMLDGVSSEFIEYKKVLNINGLKVFLINSETLRFEGPELDNFGDYNVIDYNFKENPNISLKYLEDSDGEYYLIEGEEDEYGDRFRHLFSSVLIRIN